MSRKMLACRLPAEVLEELRQLAAATNVSQSELVAKAIRLLASQKEMQELVAAVQRVEALVPQNARARKRASAT